MWKVYFRYLIRKEFGMTSFYLFPTIEYFRDKTFDDDGDCSFDISLSWLFWSLTFTRYWGSAYSKNSK